MNEELPENNPAKSPELDFTGCTTLDHFLERVEIVLVQAGGAHKQQCITAEKAIGLLHAQVAPKFPLTDDQKALLVSNAIFPDDTNLAHDLQIAITPDACGNLDPSVRNKVSREVIKRGYPEVAKFMKDLVS